MERQRTSCINCADPRMCTSVGAMLNRQYDFLIVGAGLYGVTFARIATDMGARCLVIDRRPHVGGNVYCEKVAGIMVHKYGAHIFHTNREDVWRFVTHYARFAPYIHRVSARSGGKLYSMPFNLKTFRQLWGNLEPAEIKRIISVQRVKYEPPKNLEEQALSLIGKDIYEALVKGYTEKQWGKPCCELPASIIQRIPLRFTDDDRYFADKYQGIPEGGYTAMVERMLGDIPVITGLDYRMLIKISPNIAAKTIYTGPIDEYYEYCLGKLEYRSLQFKEEVLDREIYQERAVINECDAETEFTRTIEHKHFEWRDIPKTVITREYPQPWTPERIPYYPINDLRNSALYQSYVKLAKKTPNLYFGGRLGEYRYYNMDEVIAAALQATKNI